MSAPTGIWLVGAGNMGGAMLRKWVATGVHSASILVIDPGDPSVPQGVRVVAEAPAHGVPDVLVLAIKPQQLGMLALPSLVDIARGQAPLLISILAGVEEASLASHVPARAIVRAMPNLPVSIGKGVVALHTDSDDPAARETAGALMAPLGLVEWIGDEALFDAVTALSGCGPGFLYRFIDAMADAAVALGLPADQAMRLAVATVEGSALLAAQADEPPAILADRVASPGGSTREGLNVLDRDLSLKSLMRETLAAAARRNAEMAAAARS